MVACHSPQREAKASEPIVEFVEDAEMPDSALSALDSLMWTHPDSALALLQGCRDVACNDSTTEHDRHYANLLLAELHYKNNSAQTNRAELL